MLAIWAGASAKAEGDLRARACRAALGIAQAVDRFNRSSGAPALPTRIGLNAGPMLLGNIGAVDHYEYRAVGDMVNTATRIQGLNKVLRTRILVARESVAGLTEFQTRALGVFLLPGKSKPIEVCELLCARADADAVTEQSCALFAAALADYGQRRWEPARAGFGRLLGQNPADVPARLYQDLCERWLSAPPGDSWTATVRIETR